MRSTPKALIAGSASQGSSSPRGSSPRWLRLVVFTAAVAALLFVATGATLWHHDAPGTYCSICHAAHIPALSSAPVRTPVTSSAVAGVVPAEFLVDHATPETLNSSPRAPPL